MSQSEWCHQYSADVSINLSVVTRCAFSPSKCLAHDTAFPNPRDGLLVYTADRVVKTFTIFYTLVREHFICYVVTTQKIAPSWSAKARPWSHL